MARGMWIDIDDVGLHVLVDELGATQPQLEAAMRSTYAKLGRWARGRAVRGLSATTGVQQKILRRRVKAFRMQHGIDGGGAAKVWFGMKPIKLSHMHPRQTKEGVRADGGRFYKGAFIVNRNGRPTVFKRDGKSRLPIRELQVDIADQVQTYIEDTLVGSPEFEAQFFKLLEHELKWRTRTQT